MSEGGGGGFNHNLWAQQNLGQQGAADDVKVNEDETGKLIELGPDKAIPVIVKTLVNVPVIGWLIGTFFPSNAGKVSLFAGLEASEGFLNKPMNQKGASIADVSGGVLAKIAGGLISNRSIPGGTPYGDGGSGGGDGGGSGGGGDGGSAGGGSFNYESGFSGLDSAPIIAAGGGNRFEWQPEAMESLGFLRPMATPNMGGQGMGAGMDLG